MVETFNRRRPPPKPGGKEDSFLRISLSLSISLHSTTIARRKYQSINQSNSLPIKLLLRLETLQRQRLGEQRLRFRIPR